MDLISDKILVPWQILLILGGMVMIFAGLPRLVRHCHKIHNQTSPKWSERFGAIFLLVLTASLLLPTILLLIALPFFVQETNDGALLCPMFVFLFLTGMCFFIFQRVIESWPMPVKKLWLPFLLSIGLGFAFDGCATRTLSRVRDLSKRTADASNLKQISAALHFHQEEYGLYPDSLGRLVEGDFACSSVLTSHFSENAGVAPTSTQPFQGPIDFTYIRLPEDAPKNLIWIWENPDFFDGEGGWVLYFSYEVEWLEAEELKKQVAETHEWLEKNLTTSAPADGRRE